jgi:hypothetical protein
MEGNSPSGNFGLARALSSCEIEAYAQPHYVGSNFQWIKPVSEDEDRLSLSVYCDTLLTTSVYSDFNYSLPLCAS